MNGWSDRACEDRRIWFLSCASHALRLQQAGDPTAAMSRRCSHCGNNGHNSRTCVDKGFKLFGVRLTEPLAATAAAVASSACSFSCAMRKSVSMGNLSSYGYSDAASGLPAGSPEQPCLDASSDGYVSDDFMHTTGGARERKKGVPWSEEEHRLFLLGLQQLGKGDWRGISRNFVLSRTPTQVASHAQKYFLRRSSLNKRRRRSSLFDITPETVSSLTSLEETELEESLLDGSNLFSLKQHMARRQDLAVGEAENVQPDDVRRPRIPVGRFPAQLVSLPLSYLATPVGKLTREAREAEVVTPPDDYEIGEAAEKSFLRNSTYGCPDRLPEGTTSVVDFGTISSHASSPLPLFSFWSETARMTFEEQSNRKIVKPTPIIPKALFKMDESTNILGLSLNSNRPMMKPSSLTYKLMEEGSRQSAFHSLPSVNSTEFDTQGNLRSAISVA